MTDSERFDVHLSVCRQCELHPFDLCTEGQELLKLAAYESVTKMRATYG